MFSNTLRPPKKTVSDWVKNKYVQLFGGKSPSVLSCAFHGESLNFVAMLSLWCKLKIPHSLVFTSPLCTKFSFATKSLLSSRLPEKAAISMKWHFWTKTSHTLSFDSKSLAANLLVHSWSICPPNFTLRNQTGLRGWNFKDKSVFEGPPWNSQNKVDTLNQNGRLHVSLQA